MASNHSSSQTQTLHAQRRTVNTQHFIHRCGCTCILYDFQMLELLNSTTTSATLLMGMAWMLSAMAKDERRIDTAHSRLESYLYGPGAKVSCLCVVTCGVLNALSCIADRLTTKSRRAKNALTRREMTSKARWLPHSGTCTCSCARCPSPSARHETKNTSALLYKQNLLKITAKIVFK